MMLKNARLARVVFAAAFLGALVSAVGAVKGEDGDGGASRWETSATADEASNEASGEAADEASNEAAPIEAACAAACARLQRWGDEKLAQTNQYLQKQKTWLTEESWWAQEENWRRVQEKTEDVAASMNEVARKWEPSCETPLIREILRRSAWLNGLEWGDLRNNFVLEAILYCAIASVVATLWEAASLILRGATCSHLLKTRFGDVSTVRAQILCFLLTLWGVFAIAAYTVTFPAVMDYSDRSDDVVRGCCLGGILFIDAVLFYLLFKLSRFLKVPARPRALFDEGNELRITFRDGASRRRSAKINLAAFPEALGRGQELGVKARLLFLCAQLFFAALFLFEFDCVEWAGRNTAWFCLACTFDLLPQIPLFQPAAALFLGVGSCLTLIVLLTCDWNYVALRFTRTFFLSLALATLSFFCFCSLTRDRFDARFWQISAFYALDIALLCRCVVDMARVWRYRRRRTAARPIAKKTKRRFERFMEKLLACDNEQASLNESRIAWSIKRGLNEIATRKFGASRSALRSLRSARVERVPLVAIKFQALTYKRKVVLDKLCPTSERRRRPYVAYMDERRFPLKPPGGCRDYDDCEWLGSEYHCVLDCSFCSGKGYNTHVEYYTEYSCGERKTRERRTTVRCRHCDACGRILYSQGIKTKWRAFIATTTAPETTGPNLFDGEVGKTYFEYELMEDRQETGRLTCDAEMGADLRSEVERAIAQIGGREKKRMLSRAQWRCGGALYRADLSAVQVEVVKVALGRVFKQYGWLVNRGSQFIFHGAPFDWATIASLVFVVPTCVATAAAALMNCLEVCERFGGGNIIFELFLAGRI